MLNDVKSVLVSEEEIKEILLNRRKIEFLQQLETAIYNDALQGGEIIYYQ